MQAEVPARLDHPRDGGGWSASVAARPPIHFCVDYEKP